jgi:hypothetical protein
MAHTFFNPSHPRIRRRREGNLADCSAVALLDRKVCFWPEADVGARGVLGRLLTLMYGPAARRKSSSSSWWSWSCIYVSGLCLERLLLAIMDISAPATSLADRPERAIWVTSVRGRREDRPPSQLDSLADLGGQLIVGRASIVRQLAACSPRRRGRAPRHSRQCVRAC